MKYVRKHNGVGFYAKWAHKYVLGAFSFTVRIFLKISCMLLVFLRAVFVSNAFCVFCLVIEREQQQTFQTHHEEPKSIHRPPWAPAGMGRGGGTCPPPLEML